MNWLLLPWRIVFLPWLIFAIPAGFTLAWMIGGIEFAKWQAGDFVYFAWNGKPGPTRQL